jgi:hypothetical protein
MAASVEWWGRRRVPVGSAGRWRIGPLTLWIQRLEGEWRIAHETGDDPLDVSLREDLPADVDDLLEKEGVARFVKPGRSEEVVLAAALADRPVVTSSEQPLSVPPGEEVAVYVSSPLWVQVEVGKPARRLCELPVFRPSDTWFGPDTTEGELCYASRTFHRVRLEDVPVRPHRATTAVKIKNRARTMLSLERMQVPVMHLALYRAEDGRLWTQDVVFEREGDVDFVALRLGGRGKPAAAGSGEAKLVAGPRVQPSGGIVVRAFGSLFSR